MENALLYGNMVQLCAIIMKSGILLFGKNMKHDIRDYLSVFQYRRFLRSDWVEVLNLFCMLTFPLRHGTFCAIDLHMVCRDHGNLESLRDGIPFGRVVLQHLRQQPESKVSSTPELCWGLQDSKSNSQKSGFHQVQISLYDYIFSKTNLTIRLISDFVCRAVLIELLQNLTGCVKDCVAV